MMRGAGTGTRRIVVAALAAVTAAVVLLGAETLRRGGYFTSLEPYFGGVCTTIPMGASAADIRIDHDRALAYLSYRNRLADAGHSAEPGTVMLVDLNAPRPRPRAALTIEPPDFRPAAISLYSAPGQPRRLFAVSLRRPPVIEIFEQTASGAFAPVETLSGLALTAPTGIVAVGPRQIYVAEDSSPRGWLGQARGLWLRRGASRLVYFDGTSLRTVAGGLEAPAGLEVSGNGESLYVADAGSRRLLVFRRDVVTGALVPGEAVELGSAPDGVTLDEHGGVWIAAHPRPLDWIRHRVDPAARGPTQVLEFRPSARGTDRLVAIYLSTGAPLSAASVAAVHGDRMLLGSMYDTALLDCALPTRRDTLRAD